MYHDELKLLQNGIQHQTVHPNDGWSHGAWTGNHRQIVSCALLLFWDIWP